MKKLFLLLILLAGMSQAQTTVAPFISPAVQLFDNSGLPLNGGKVCTFAAGTTTPLATYSDNGVTTNTNPVILDSAGRGVIYLQNASYKIVIAASTANSSCVPAIKTQDNVSWANLASTVTSLTANGTVQVIPATAATGGANQTGPNTQFCGNYWTGSASAADCWTLADILGTGTNPTSTLTLTHSGSSGAATFSVPGNQTVGGALGVTKCSAIDGVVCADGQAGADMGAKVNAAFAACTTTPCTVFVGIPGTYTYTTDIAFAAPVRFQCAQGVILNYTGTGKAVKLGPDGLVVGTVDQNIYEVSGCTFTGGASMTHGIYVNEFITHPRIFNNFFHNFGNSTAYNIWFQGQNWDIRVHDNTMWGDIGATITFNGIAQNAADPANGVNGDFGNSQGTITNNIIQNGATHSTGVGIYANGNFTAILHNTVAGFYPPIELGAYCIECSVEHTDSEVSGSTNCINYGDPLGATRVSSYTDGVTIKDNYCVVHNTDFGSTAHFMGPQTTSSGLQNSYIANNRVATLTAGQPLIVMNNNGSQTGNYAANNLISTGFTPFLPVFLNLHTITGSTPVSLFDGSDESSGHFYVYHAFTNASNMERGGCTWTGIAFRCGAEAQGTGAFQTFQIVGNNIDFFTGTTFAGLTARWEIQATAGHFGAFTDNSSDIGFSATANRPRNVFAGTSVNVNNGAAQMTTTGFTGNTYSTTTNCSSAAGTCVAAPAGAVTIAAAASTVTVATTAVTANSDITLTRNDALSTRLSVTCNTATAAGDIKVSTITPGTSFVITVQNAPAVNPLCLTYSIVN